jgi:hypothetical protein
MASATTTVPVVEGVRRSRLDSLKRALAMLLLPASIVPVPLLGPTLLRAPHRLWRQASAEIQRLQEGQHR